jgi:D-alanyl-D-alanine-carboxypeptidase/D-alanyl-D-alanine-endopeptidase
MPATHGRQTGWTAVALLAIGAALAGCHAALPPPAKAPPTISPMQHLANPPKAALQAIFVDTGAIGMAAAVVEGDQGDAFGFGQRGAANSTPVDPRTLVRLQSLSKLFTADLLSADVAAGQVALTDPLLHYAPTGWKAPAGSVASQIELVNLASHTAGLPRDALDPQTIYADDAQPARWAWLADPTTKLSPPGKGAQYSNVGFDFLGDALARRAGASYGQALATTITGPLGMADTTPTPSAEQCARMMQGDPHKPPHPCIDQSGEAASGGLYTTASDMALWLRAQLAPNPAGDRRRISQAIYFPRAKLGFVGGLDHAGKANGVGLAWIELAPTADHPRVLEKTGGGDGFLTYVVIDPAERIGVFIAFDNMSGHRLKDVADDANKLVGQLGGMTPPPPTGR